MNFETVRDPDLPSREFIKNQTAFAGGEVFIVGLTPQQADALLKYADQKGIREVGRNIIQIIEKPLSELTIKNLREGGRSIPDGSVTISLGHTLECHKPLFWSLGISFKQ